MKLLLRFLTVGGLVLLLMIPLMMIRDTVHERQVYRGEAIERVAHNTAGAQVFIGPLRVLPWTDIWQVEVTDDKGVVSKRVERSSGQLVQLPRSLVVDGKLAPNTLKVGLYPVSVYEWHANLKARFDDELPATADNVVRVYGAPYLVIGISDVRGLVGTPLLRVDGKALRLAQGTRSLSNRFSGVHAPLPAVVGGVVAGHQVELDFVLKGTQSLALAPIADENRVTLHSTWPHPKFDGYSPRSEITDAGFKATWEISSLASNAQAQFRSVPGVPAASLGVTALAEEALRVSHPNVDTLRVSLVDPVDTYTQVDRASKYGILFVLLTFVGFALFELIKRLPIHPLQYLLVGLALAIFFLLLLSLSEHIAFWQAYLLSAVACIGLQFVYLSGMLGSWPRAAGFAATLTALYGVLYNLLISEDNALLMGSLLLFGVLAAIMWITRKVDWYELASGLR